MKQFTAMVTFYPGMTKQQVEAVLTTIEQHLMDSHYTWPNGFAAPPQPCKWQLDEHMMGNEPVLYHP